MTAVISRSTAAARSASDSMSSSSPGASVYAHEHSSDEEFLMIEGELIENDGTVYRKGDLVWLKAGTQHSSHSPGGCQTSSM